MILSKRIYWGAMFILFIREITKNLHQENDSEMTFNKKK